MSTVLLTGATGFVGSHIAKALVRQGYRVRCLLRTSSSPQYLPAEVEQVIAALDDESGLERALKGCDIVIHAAGVTRVQSNLEYLQVNVTGTANLASAVKRSGVRRFVFISSLAARGPDGHSAPVSLYGASKLAAEQVLRGYAGAFELVMLRPAGVYGPRDRDFLTLFQMAERGVAALPAGDLPLQLIHATDVAEACLAALRCQIVKEMPPLPLASSEVVNQQVLINMLAQLSNCHLYTMRLPAQLLEFAGLLAEGAGYLSCRAPAFDRRRARDIAHYSYTCDTSVTTQVLQWQARTRLSEGLAATRTWYQNAGWL